MGRSFLICGIADDVYPRLFGDKADEVKANITAGLARTEQQFKEAGCEFKVVKMSPNAEGDLGRWEGYVSEQEWDGIFM